MLASLLLLAPSALVLVFYTYLYIFHFFLVLSGKTNNSMAISKKRVSHSLPPHSPPPHLHHHVDVDVDVVEEEEAVAEQKLDPEEHSPTPTIPPHININNDAAAATATTSPLNLNPMERRKKRKRLDKERPRLTSLDQADSSSPMAHSTTNPPPPASSFPHALDLNLFSQLSSPVASVRESAVESLVTTLRLVQLDFQRQSQRQAKERGVVFDGDRGSRLLEAHKDDGLQNCADNVRYSVRRLIRGVSSSRAVSALPCRLRGGFIYYVLFIYI